jgi:HPt (histidine-containing phosphotransfer) domain-containing protein
MSPANSNRSPSASGVVSETGKKAAEQATDKAPTGKDAISYARIDRLRNSMPGKDGLIDELIDLFVADLSRWLGAISHAIEQADAPALALQAYALRGGASNFGALRLDELCARLEEIGARGTLAEAPAMFDEVLRETLLVREALLVLKIQLFF